jgi:DNA-3-methyladenine glycosylase II
VSNLRARKLRARLHAQLPEHLAQVVLDSARADEQLGSDLAVERVVQAGAQPVTWVALAVELQRDWAREETAADVIEIVLTRTAATTMSVAARPRKRAALANPEAREFLRNADPVLAQLIDARPDFRPRAWMDQLPPLDAFGTLVFQVAGQQLSVSSTRAIISHLQEQFGGHLPSPPELLAADPKVLRASGFSARKGETLRALAERFVDGRLSDEALSRMTDEEVEKTLTEVPGIGPWTARGFLLVGLDRPDVFLSGDLALRRAIQRAYGFDHLPTEDEVAQVSDRWRPHRSLAVSYLFASEYDGRP